MTEQAKAVAAGEGSIGGGGGDGYNSGHGQESQGWDVRKKKRRIKQVVYL